ncbi:MAG: hypothetical protein U0165_06865 [Polyangiaceae bacterium]
MTLRALPGTIEPDVAKGADPSLPCFAGLEGTTIPTMPFERDPSHWLYRLSPREWIQLALEELERAESYFTQNQARAGYVSAKRAAGMALNGALIVAPDDSWGRSFVDHIHAVGRDERVPDAVREAAVRLASAEPPGGAMVTLRSRSGEQRLIESSRTVMAHAYAIVIKGEPEANDDSSGSSSPGSTPPST